MNAFKSLFATGGLADICAQIEAARAAYKADHPDEELVVAISARDIAKAEKADLFARRLSVLRPLLPWIASPEKPDFADYVIECPAQKRAVAICRRFAERFLDRVVDDKSAAHGIVLVGTPGTGKTRLALSALKCLADQGAPGFFISASEYFDLFTPAYCSKLDAPLTKIRTLLAGVSCLVVDDVGVAAWTDARRDRLQQLLDARSANRLPTIITTNLTKDSFSEAGAERIVSRFDQLLYPIVATWGDYRSKKALKSQTIEDVF